ncbi:alpha/beta fold hydrolase [Paenibacillus sp. KQZ6P-2]|uniref:Alpha/beta fold hydrolase n=1 Tax=Paenibacillus mangrovi TaxID=2931978 RepID=A0A9X2B846_9BACL|nr:alpha/beta hydrolase [Paenibacillus mangrovi]MCJ8014088.1 alpha/beta fold hydrolase [Paenibacillus mangrovi]
MERQIFIRHGQEELTASLHYPAQTEGENERCEERSPLVVICHGFVGSRVGVDRLFVKTARILAEEGYMVLRFDYAGCGESSGHYGKEGLESMIAQTRTVLDYALECGNVDPSKVTLIGHSLGGAVAILTAVRDRRVKNLILWSAVGYPLSDILKITGRDVYDYAVKTGRSDYLGFEFTPAFFDSLGSYQPFQEAIKFSGDVLVVHGTSDDTIPVDYAFLYQKVFWMRSEGRCDKEIIFQGNHTYSSGAHCGQLIERTKEWLNEQKTLQQDWQHWMI